MLLLCKVVLMMCSIRQREVFHSACAHGCYHIVRSDPSHVHTPIQGIDQGEPAREVRASATSIAGRC